MQLLCNILPTSTLTPLLSTLHVRAEASCWPKSDPLPLCSEPFMDPAYSEQKPKFSPSPCVVGPIAFCPQLFPFSPSSLPHRPLAISRTFQEGSLLDFFAFASPLARTWYPTAHFVKLPSFYSVSQFLQAFPDTPDTSAPSAPCVVCP